jgi:hypothetical protein
MSEMVDHLANAEYGAPETWKLDDDRIVRVKVEIDQDTNVVDDEFFGQFEQTRENDYGPVRPSGFDGRARIVSRDQAFALWWQPADDVQDVDALERDVRELLEYGYLGIVAEKCEGQDGYGRPIVRDVASLWGIESMVDDAYKREVVRDLLHELGIETG